MAAVYNLRPATIQDAVHLVLNLRPGDREELKAAGSPHSVEARICDTIGASDEGALAWEELESGHLLAVGGFRNVTERTSIAWLLGTNEMGKHPLAFQKTARRLIRQHFREHPRCTTLTNAVYSRNHKAVEWLDRLGAVYTREFLPVGCGGELFHFFSIGRGGYV